MSRYYDDYRRSAYGGISRTTAQQFSLSESDFQRDAVLKRRRYLSPPRNNASTLKASSASSTTDGTIAFRQRRSVSKSRGRTLSRRPSTANQEFYALGRNDSGQKITTRYPSVDHSTRRRSRTPERSRATSASVSKRTRSPSVARVIKSEASVHRRSKSSSRRDKHEDEEEEKEKKKKRSSSISRQKSSSASSRKERSSAKALQSEVQATEAKLQTAKDELQTLEAELLEITKKVEAKKYQVADLQIVMDGLEKRKQLQQQFLRQEERYSSDGNSSSRSTSHRRERSVSRSRRSKRPCIIDEDEDEEEEETTTRRHRLRRPSTSQELTEDEEEDDEEVEIIDPVKREPVVSSVKNVKKTDEEPKADPFWGLVEEAKLCGRPRIQLIPDGSARKLRHLAFNPLKPDVFATTSDDGSLVLWSYAHQQINRLVGFTPTSFRDDAQCQESIAWSPDGNRLAMAFRDPLHGKGAFCVAKLHQLPLGDGVSPQTVPSDRVSYKSTAMHARGISTIDWIRAGDGDALTSRGLITAGSDHAVVLWEEHDRLRNEHGMHEYVKGRVLHREHRSEVRSLCVHSQRNWVFSGGLDGLVVRFDLQRSRVSTILERRKPSISKINAILEHKDNPNLLLISSVEPTEQNLMLYDLRAPRDDHRMTLRWLKTPDSRSMSQYIVPRWSNAGYHVSCGSTNGLINIWDVRVRHSTVPHQSLRVHNKQVLHATWHPADNAMISVSNDRNIGLMTFM